MNPTFSEHWNDANENPGGGITSSRGLTISWQNGTLDKEPNGAFVEDVIGAAIDRLKYYQQSKFTCEANAHAIIFLESALESLHSRTKDRENRGVEGTHQL